MIKKVLIVCSEYWIKQIYLDCIIKNKLRNVILISNKKNAFIEEKYFKKTSSILILKLLKI